MSVIPIEVHLAQMALRECVDESPRLPADDQCALARRLGECAREAQLTPAIAIAAIRSALGLPPERPITVRRAPLPPPPGPLDQLLEHATAAYYGMVPDSQLRSPTK